jgi:hypothetical protein
MNIERRAHQRVATFYSMLAFGRRIVIFGLRSDKMTYVFYKPSEVTDLGFDGCAVMRRTPSAQAD